MESMEKVMDVREHLFFLIKPAFSKFNIKAVNADETELALNYLEDENLGLQSNGVILLPYNSRRYTCS
jgi:hypothetical protein